MVECCQLPLCSACDNCMSLKFHIDDDLFFYVNCLPFGFFPMTATCQKSACNGALVPAQWQTNISQARLQNIHVDYTTIQLQY